MYGLVPNFTSAIDLRSLLKKQNRLHRLFKTNESKYRDRYKKFRTHVNLELENAKKQYIKDLCDNVAEKPKKF